MVKTRMVRALGLWIVLGIAGPALFSPPDASAALVICKRKARIKIREDVCKSKEEQIPAAELGVTGPEGPQGPAGPGAMWALVAADGSIIAQSGGISVTAANGSGGYYVDFGTSVAGKLILATPSDVDLAYTGTVLASPCGGGVGGVSCVAPGTDDTNHVFVFTSASANASGADHAFYVTVIG